MKTFMNILLTILGIQSKVRQSLTLTLLWLNNTIRPKYPSLIRGIHHNQDEDPIQGPIPSKESKMKVISPNPRNFRTIWSWIFTKKTEVQVVITPELKPYNPEREELMNRRWIKTLDHLGNEVWTLPSKQFILRHMAETERDFMANEAMKKLMTDSVAFEATNRRLSTLDFKGLIDDSGTVKSNYGYVRMDVDGRVDHLNDYWCCGHQVFAHECPRCKTPTYEAKAIKRQRTKIMVEGKIVEAMVSYLPHELTHLWSKEETGYMSPRWSKYWYEFKINFPSIYRAWNKKKNESKTEKYSIAKFISYCHTVKHQYEKLIINAEYYHTTESKIADLELRIENIKRFFTWTFGFEKRFCMNHNFENKEGMFQFSTIEVNASIGKKFIKTSKGYASLEALKLFNSGDMIVFLPSEYVNHKVNKDLEESATLLSGLSLDASENDALGKSLESYSTTEKGYDNDGEETKKTIVIESSFGEEVSKNIHNEETYQEFLAFLKHGDFMKELKSFVEYKTGEKVRKISDIKKYFNLMSEEDKKYAKKALLDEVNGIRDFMVEFNTKVSV